MRILSGALPATDTFLHVGYLSAAPREWGQYGAPEQTMHLLLDGVPVDVAEALRLEGEAAPAGPSAARVGPAGAIGTQDFMSLATSGFLLTIVLGLMMVYSARKNLRTHRVRGLLDVALATVCAVMACYFLLPYVLPNPYSLPSPNSPPPWQGVTLRAYADPAAATQVLMHGILSDALSNAGNPVSTLAQVKGEVGLPARDLTEGERYALQTYGLDGWGHAFRLKGQHMEELEDWFRSYTWGSRPATSLHPSGDASPQYLLTSAGPDGTFDTSDDLRTSALACVEYNWDAIPRAPYLYEDHEQLFLLFHRWKGNNFQYANREMSQRLFGGLLYDLVFVEASKNPTGFPTRPFLSADLSQTVRKNYERVASKVPYSPLVLMLPPKEPRALQPKPALPVEDGKPFPRLASSAQRS